MKNLTKEVQAKLVEYITTKFNKETFFQDISQTKSPQVLIMKMRFLNECFENQP